MTFCTEERGKEQPEKCSDGKTGLCEGPKARKRLMLSGLEKKFSNLGIESVKNKGNEEQA